MKLLSNALKIALLFTSATTGITESSSNMEAINSWLDANGLNEFGDPPGTMYMGGNPLFNEMTGKSTDRAEYLIKKFPAKPWESEGEKEELR